MGFGVVGRELGCGPSGGVVRAGGSKADGRAGPGLVGWGGGRAAGGAGLAGGQTIGKEGLQIALTKDTFVSEFKTTKNVGQSASHESSSHKMPPEFTAMTHPVKTWRSLTPDSVCKSAASWNWIHDYFAKYKATGVSIGQSKLSKLLRPLTIVRHVPTDIVYASMGNYLYAALAVRLLCIIQNCTTYYKFVEAPVEFVYVVEHYDWEVINYEAIRYAGHGILMTPVGKSVPLMIHTLGTPLHSLNEDDLDLCFEHTGVELPRTTPKARETIPSKLAALAKHFCGDDEHAAKIQAGLFEDAYLARDNTDEDLLADPLLEAVFDAMDEDDKGEFKEIGDARQKKRYNSRMATYRKKCAQAQPGLRGRPPRMKPRAKAGAKKKAKAAAKAKAQANAGANAAAATPQPKAKPKDKPKAKPKAKAANAEAAARAGAVEGNSSAWLLVDCPSCGKVLGRKKYVTSPGLRDSASWVMVNFLHDIARYPNSGPYYRVRTQSTLYNPETEITDLLYRQRTCCAGGEIPLPRAPPAI